MAVTRTTSRLFCKPDAPTGICPGCGYGIIKHILAEVMEEMDMDKKAIGVLGIGCSGFVSRNFDIDWFQAQHGRAPASATGIKRLLPDNIVFTFQGDGDLAAIGTAEVIHAAARNENLTVLFANNSNYGMTGGQMAPTTLIGMKSTTTPQGRRAEEYGYPMHMCEILNQLTAPYYLERTSCNNPANVRKTKKAIRKAFENQLNNKGFSMVEIVTSCPTNWGLDALEAMNFLEEKMFAEYPLGVVRDKSVEEER